MRLFGKVDGNIDRHDRAEWLSLPFDLAWLNSIASKLFIVYLELRRFAIEAEDVSPDVAVEGKRFAVEAESRRFSVFVEDRTFAA